MRQHGAAEMALLCAPAKWTVSLGVTGVRDDN